MEKIEIWPYHSTMNSSELSYPYHIFIVFLHKKLTFSHFGDTWEQIAYLWHHFTKGGE